MGAGGALPLIMSYRERPRPVKGAPFSDFRVGNSRVEVIKRVVKSSIEVFKRSFNKNALKTSLMAISFESIYKRQTKMTRTRRLPVFVMCSY